MNAAWTRAAACRICGNPRLAPVLDLGEQCLTGVFPRDRHEPVTRGPLRLVRCRGEGACGLVQLEHSYDAGAMYGDNYGYRSGLNPAMVRHLHAKVARLRERIDLRPGDVVLDIGSNDGTTLRAYPAGLELVGIDPTGEKFREYFPSHARLVPDFFSAASFRANASKPARVVTSFSMFYDLEDPPGFMREVASVLADDGVWEFEQSYLPAMLAANSFDTVCHEHIEFYALAQIEWMANAAGLRLLDVEFNDVNGGSFSVTAALAGSPHVASERVAKALENEAALGLHRDAPFEAFARRVGAARDALHGFFDRARFEGKRVYGLGASTKGNVLLQYCGLGPREIAAIGEVNPDKFGCVTPGTFIPIEDEAVVLGSRPDYLLVLPWHFREFFLAQPRFRDTTLVFPLPALEIIPPRGA